MIKKMLMILYLNIFLMIPLYSNEQFFDELFFHDLSSIRGISYMDFDFMEHNEFQPSFAHNQVIIHGWSKNGYIFYSFYIAAIGSRTYKIRNLVTDEIVEMIDSWDFRTGRVNISEIVTRFNIEPNVGVIGEFPFSWNNYEYQCFGINERNQNPWQRNENPRLGRLIIDIIATRNGSQKIINTILCNPMNHSNAMTGEVVYYVQNYIESVYKCRAF